MAIVERGAGEAVRFHPCTLREFARALGLSVGAGAALGAVLAFAQGRGAGRSILLGAYTGGWIYLLSVTLAFLASPLLERLPRAAARAVFAALCFVAGAGAWLVSLLTLPRLSGGRIALEISDLRATLIFAGILGAVVGGLLFTYFSLRARLEANLRRLQEREQVARDIEAAREVQKRLLPPASLAANGYRIESRNLPASFVAGDFYDVFPRPDGTVGVIVGDVAGKGLGASLIMASVKGRMPLLLAGQPPAAALARLGEHLRAELPARSFVALCVAVYDPASGRLVVANAGMPDPFLLAPGAPARSIVVPGPRYPLGVRQRIEYEQVEARLAIGERLLLFSDGLAELQMPNGDPLGYAALATELGAAWADAAEWLDALLARLEARGSAGRGDDWTALLLERTG